MVAPLAKKSAPPALPFDTPVQEWLELGLSRRFIGGYAEIDASLKRSELGTRSILGF